MPTAEYNPADLTRLVRFNKAPIGQPRAGGKSEVPSQHFEEYSPATELDRELAWIFPGLVYSIVGLDRSLFSMYSAASGKTIKVKTHKAANPLIRFGQVLYSSNQWAYTVQGIEPGIADAFLDYVGSFKFKSAKADWTVTPTKTRLADPFSKTRSGLDVTFLLPDMVSHRKRLVIQEPAGLMLNTPAIGIVSYT